MENKIFYMKQIVCYKLINLGQFGKMYPSLRPYTCIYMQLGYNSLQHASVSFYELPADFSKFASQASRWKARFKKNFFFPLAGYSTKASILLYLKQKQNLQFDKEFSSKSQCGTTKNAY